MFVFISVSYWANLIRNSGGGGRGERERKMTEAEIKFLTLSVIPKRVTMDLAILVAFSKSLAAPVNQQNNKSKKLCNYTDIRETRE